MVTVDQPFGMPLNPDSPAGTDTLHSFDDPIGCECSGMQPPPELVNGLMMKTVHRNVRLPYNAGDATAGNCFDGVRAVVLGEIGVVIMFFRLRTLGGDILPEGPPGSHIKDLDTAAYRQNREMRLHRPAGHLQFDNITGRGYLAEPRNRGLVKMDGIEIRTADQQQAVYHAKQRSKNARRLNDRYDERYDLDR